MGLALEPSGSAIFSIICMCIAVSLCKSDKGVISPYNLISLALLLLVESIKSISKENLRDFLITLFYR